MAQQVAAVCIVLALLGFFLYFVRSRRGMNAFGGLLQKRPGGERSIAVLERMPLTPHHSLHLVRVLDKTILIGVSPSGCQELAIFAGSQSSSAAGGGSC
jgi:flagellar biogenesis protein FliO